MVCQGDMTAPSTMTVPASNPKYDAHQLTHLIYLPEAYKFRDFGQQHKTEFVMSNQVPQNLSPPSRYAESQGG
jgi:hypothetical protein